ncbi:DUF4192 domain-containing protein [Ornithinimicrobium sp. INDO-MA30-4]|uniref:DUF4192 domain-containing protein n=1 Tax=Ornithinimicrobium sp. INDO-MA30-4 TaxID=2908651 RepID=UPI001F3C326B|nr:DUF4192 domain-containing protein [Ornithinimicrobium sp. INDO-MA30-4]UJH71356.1 DUF4192 domain-containing protein [Ornithinimicrobium sp. INDO-MA30-4]
MTFQENLQPEAFRAARSGQGSAAIRGVGQLVAVLPYHLGYQPADSLVLVCLEAAPEVPEQSRISLTARVSMTSQAAPAELAQALAPAFLRARPRAVVCLGFEGEVTDSRPFLGSVEEVARQAGVEHVHSGRVWAQNWWNCSSPEPSWEPVPAARDVPAVADYVVAGTHPLASRAHIEQCLRPAISVERAADISAAARAFQVRLPDASAVVQGLQVISTVLSDPLVDPSVLCPRDVGSFVGLMDWTASRDAVLQAAAPGLVGADVGDSLVSLAREIIPTLSDVDEGAALRFAKLAAQVPVGPGSSASAWACAAYLAWWKGDGSLANIANDRALAIDPEYRLAQLIDSALRTAMPPSR